MGELDKIPLDSATRKQLDKIAEHLGVTIEDLGTEVIERFVRERLQPVEALVSASRSPKRRH
jgi:hypothetical protein